MNIDFSNEEKDGFLIKKAYFEKENYYFKIPLCRKKEMTDLADPFVLLLVFRMMRQGGEFFIKGKVSKSLLDNLELFTSYWNVLFPRLYKKIEINAEYEINDEPRKLENKAVAAFSGGLDASFMLYRHKKGLAGRNNRNIEKAVIIFGFDTPLNDEGRNKRDFRNCKNICSDLGTELIPVEINYRYYPTRWHMEHLACAAAVLRLWKDYPYQMIASSYPVNDFKMPWASNPVTDHLLSSDRNKVIVDDMDFTRMEKTEFIKDWKTGIDNLRLCWNGGGKAALNCGVCEKCLRTYLNFRAVGIEKLSCMALEFKAENIKKIDFSEGNLLFYRDILNYARNKSIKDDVFTELEKAVNKYLRKERMKRLNVIKAGLLSKITFGERRNHYIQKTKNLKRKKDYTDIYVLK